VRGTLRTPNLSKKQAAKRVLVCEQGVILIDHEGLTGSFRFDGLSVLQEITEQYRNGVRARTDYLFTLTDRSGSEAKLTQFYDRINDLGTAIQRGVTRAQLPHVLAAIKQGQQVPFGDLKLTYQGIITRKGGLAWPEVQGIDIKRGVIHIGRAGKWWPASSTPIRSIPNVFVFLEAAEQLRGG